MKCLGATKHQDSSTIYRPTISVSLCTVCMIYVHHNMTIHVLLPSLLMFAYVCCIRYTFAFLVQSTTVSVQVKFSIKTALTSNMLPFGLFLRVLFFICKVFAMCSGLSNSLKRPWKLDVEDGNCNSFGISKGRPLYGNSFERFGSGKNCSFLTWILSTQTIYTICLS